MRLMMMAALAASLSVPAGAQPAPSVGLITELRLCAVGSGTGTNVAAEMVGGRLRTLLVRDRTGTDLFEFNPVASIPGRSVEHLASREGGLPGHGRARFQMAEVGNDGVIAVTRWDIHETQPVTVHTFTLRCATPR